MLSRIITYAFTLLLVGISNKVVSQSAVKSPKIKTIIIDAGHGGSDQGAKGSYSTEAQITLQLALRLDTLLRKELPETRFVMTRTTDIYHHVREKANIANKEIVDIIDQKIPASERENYLKLKNGVKITRVELCKLQQIIIGIVKDHGYT